MRSFAAGSLFYFCCFLIEITAFSHILLRVFLLTAGWRDISLWKNIIPWTRTPAHLAVRYWVSFALDCVPPFLQLSISFIAHNLHPSSLLLPAHQSSVSGVVCVNVQQTQAHCVFANSVCMLPSPPPYEKRRELLGRETHHRAALARVGECAGWLPSGWMQLMKGGGGGDVWCICRKEWMKAGREEVGRHVGACGGGVLHTFLWPHR